MTGIHVEAYDLTGRLTLGEVAWLLKGAKLLISNESGPMHIAAAMETPVITFFGRPEPGLSPTRWRPLGEKSFVIDKTQVVSEITRDWSKPSEGLLSLRPKEVVDLAEKLL
jgi:ADP-heptose:LPS heptosyltransferase